MKVVAIGGSPRLQGNSNYLIDQMLSELASYGVETEKFILSQCRINPCLAHDNCRELKKCLQQDDVPAILEKFSQADGVILGSPTYFETISAQLKIFLDRTFFLFTHDITPKAKCFALIAISGSGRADEAIELMKRFMGPPNVRRAKLLTMQASAGGPDKHVKDNPDLVKKARDLAGQIAEILGVKTQ